MKARIIIGANYGDEGKGTVVARYTKNAGKTLNVLTNGGSQRGHSVLTENGNITYHHFGSGTVYGADNYYSRFYILNPMQFVAEYKELAVKPDFIGYDKNCRWSTMYDMLANVIANEMKNAHGTCGMGIWNTITRYHAGICMPFGDFMKLEEPHKHMFLDKVRLFYENKMEIPKNWRNIWYNYHMVWHFLSDCEFMYKHITEYTLNADMNYDDIIFENGQGLLLSDTGKNTYDTTPSVTGMKYAMDIISDTELVCRLDKITAHYVTRPYLTRHGDGDMEDERKMKNVSKDVNEDQTNKWNPYQGEFRYGKLDIEQLRNRVMKDASDIPFEIELTHCDEMDRSEEFKKMFETVNIHDSALV